MTLLSIHSDRVTNRVYEIIVTMVTIRSKAATVDEYECVFPETL